MLGEAKRPSAPFEMISVEAASPPHMYAGNPPLKEAYYCIYTDALSSTKNQISALLNEDSLLTSASVLTEEQKAAREWGMIRMYVPLIEHIVQMIYSHHDVLEQFEYLYWDLAEYHQRYVAVYEQRIEEFVQCLTALKREHEAYYFEVIHEYNLDRYYALLEMLRHREALDRFRAILDRKEAGFEELLAVYNKSHAHFLHRPHHISFLHSNISHIRWITKARSVALKVVETVSDANTDVMKFVTS
jgi:hypothetical protein